jgi:DNA-binding LacI/PurR family transcriptional regulator
VQASDRVTIADVAGAWGVGIGTVPRIVNGAAYATIVCNVDTARQRDQHLAELTARHRSDGVIVMALAPRPHYLTLFRRASVPLVTVDVAARAVPHTVIDEVAGGRLAAEYLIALGHARIGFIGDRARCGMAGMVGYG